MLDGTRGSAAKFCSAPPLVAAAAFVRACSDGVYSPLALAGRGVVAGDIAVPLAR